MSTQDYTSKFQKPKGLDILTPQPKEDRLPIGSSGFTNHTFIGDLWKLVLKFDVGDTRIRFIPSIAPSPYEWMFKLDVYKDKAGVTFVAPSTWDPNAVDPFKKAFFWLRKNKPEVLYSRDANPTGFKLFTSQVGIAWCIDLGESGGIRIFQSSLYDGVRGGTVGLAANIFKQANDVDTEPGSETAGQKLHGDITDVETGKSVKITKTKTDKAEFASYSASIGRVALPLGPLLEKLVEGEIDKLVPIENVVKKLSEDEIHDILIGYIGNELHSEIFPERK